MCGLALFVDVYSVLYFFQHLECEDGAEIIKLVMMATIECVVTCRILTAQQNVIFYVWRREVFLLLLAAC